MSGIKVASTPWTDQKLFSSASVEWATPQDLFDLLNDEFGFGLDAAAGPHNAKCDFYIDKNQNSLTTDWITYVNPGEAVWLNPPWGRKVGDWVAKAFSQAVQYRLTVVCLLPANTDTAWWHEYVMHAAQVRLIKGRLKFIRDDGHTGPCPKGAAVVVFTPWGGPPSFTSMERP